MAHHIDILVGKRLRAARHLRGRTQMDLAAALGIKFQQIQKYETGANRVSASRLHTSAKYLGMPLTYFFGESENEIGEIADPHTMALIPVMADLDERQRKAIYDLARSMQMAKGEAA